MESKQLSPANGQVILVRKPTGWTSFDVVAKLRSILHVEKIGHAGSLDPLATGLMIVCTGKMLKQIDQFVGLEKEYIATIRLGARTSSFDAETEVIERCSVDDVTEDSIGSVLSGFVGEQVQFPPMWSAVKVSGKRLYKYARGGRVIERTPRKVFIKSITPVKISIPDVTVDVVCSKGTYIRTLADDMGRKLGCGAYLAALERTRIGEYRLEDAYSVDELVGFHRERESV